MRKGRLIAKYEFKALNKSKAQQLSDSLGNKTKIANDMALADIYNQEEMDFFEKQKPIGFKLVTS